MSNAPGKGYTPPPGTVGEQAIWLLRHYPSTPKRSPQLFEWEVTAALLVSIADDVHTHDSWSDLVMHHANQMLAYTPPEEVDLRQQIMQAQNTLAKMKSKARKPSPPPKKRR